MQRVLLAISLVVLVSSCLQLGGGRDDAVSDDESGGAPGPDSAAVDPRLAPLAWLAGTWRAEAFGGEIEETWLPPAGDSMHGVFRLVNEGALGFSEFLQVTAEDAGVVMRFAHFRRDYSTWEGEAGPMQLRLTSASDSELVFEAHAEGSPERIVYRLVGGELEVTIAGLDGVLRFWRDG